MPKYVRREPILERVKAALNPYDFLLWLSEELESKGWEQLEKEWAIPIGIGLNIVFLVARANTSQTTYHYDDVFGDARGLGWKSWLATFMTHSLILISVINAIYTFSRKKHYRLFENSVDNVPSTPSAHRVKVDSSPVSSSPLRFLTHLLASDSARSRAHPDPTKHVWQIAIWDPLPVSLRLLCYFSPGHVLIYWLFLPTLSSDPRPSTTVATAIFLALLFSAQLSLLQAQFSQQTKDSALISKELLHEYDVKYVKPRTQPLYRDVGTQFTEKASYSNSRDEQYNVVQTHTPTFVINKGFRTNPNPNYSRYTNPDGASSDGIRDVLATPTFKTPAQVRDTSSPARPLTAIRQPVFRPTPGGGDGGSLGVYSHATSPLRKSASTNFARGSAGEPSGRDRSTQSPDKRGSSPEKRMSVPSVGSNSYGLSQRWGHLQPDARSRRESGRF